MHFHYLTLIFYFVTLLFSFTDSAINSKESTNSLASCFNQSLHKALSNADPTAEFFNSSPLDCLQFCYKIQSCHIMVYHKHFSSCQLYSQIVGNGAREVLANGHDLYKRKEFCGLQEEENSEEKEN